MTRQYELVEMDGDFLGYDKCCISAHMSDKRQHVFQDVVRVQRQLVGGNYVVALGSLLKVRKDVLPAFFTSGFNPCKPDCSYATETGKRILSSMGDEEQDAYYRVLLNNTILASLNMMNMAIRSPFEADKLYKRFRENEPVIQKMPVILV